MRIRQFIMTAALIIIGLGLTGCFTKEAPPPTQLAVKFLTSSHLNPNADGEPSPVIVRLYELKTTSSFTNSDFFTLFDNDTNALAEDLVARDEFTFNPSESRIINRELAPVTRHIGVMAAFRDLDKATWRAAVEITEHKLNAYTILLGRNDISISTSKPTEE